jgi:hypothetical protein
MSAALSIGDVLIVEVYCNDPGVTQTAVLRRYWFVGNPSSSPSGVSFLDVAAYFDALLGPLYRAVLNDNADYYGTRCRRQWPVNVPLDGWGSSDASFGLGTAGAVAAPTQSCGLIKFEGAFIGKRAQGRQYLPFPATADVVGAGVPAASYITRANAIGTALSSLQVLTAGASFVTLQPVLWSPANPTLTVPITSGVAEGAWATQKRRGSFGRFNKPPF